MLPANASGLTKIIRACNDLPCTTIDNLLPSYDLSTIHVALAGVAASGGVVSGIGAVGLQNDLNRFFANRESSGGNPDKDFSWKLRGDASKLPGVEIQEINYKKRSLEDTSKLRRKFKTERNKFLRELAKDPERLKRAGLTDEDIESMKADKVPKGWNVHHKLPLDDGGDNSLDNFILMKEEPYHKTITNFQNSFTKSLKPGETKVVDWPIPEGDIYPPTH